MSATRIFAARLAAEAEWLYQAAAHDANRPLRKSRLQRLRARLRPRYGPGTADRLYAAAMAEVGRHSAAAALLPALEAAWAEHAKLRGEMTQAHCHAVARLVELLPGIEADTSKQKVKTKRRRVADKTAALTAKQMEAAQIVAECNGNITEAARRLGVAAKTVRQHYDAAMRKLGATAVRHKTEQPRLDKRSQETATSDRRLL